jgi:hypothetical protein
MPIAGCLHASVRLAVTDGNRRSDVERLSLHHFREGVIPGALVDGFPQCLLRCGHATTARAQTNTGRPTPGIAVRSLVGDHTASQRLNQGLKNYGTQESPQA